MITTMTGARLFSTSRRAIRVKTLAGASADHLRPSRDVGRDDELSFVSLRKGASLALACSFASGVE
jgi:hypothetical protein